MTELPSCEHTNIQSIKKSRGYYDAIFFDGNRERGLKVSVSSILGKYIPQHFEVLQPGCRVEFQIDPCVGTGTVRIINIDGAAINVSPSEA